MTAEGFVAYYRVSTHRQGLSGLGLEAQQAAVRDYLNGGHWTLLAEFVEVESGGKDERPLVSEEIKAQAREWFQRLQSDSTATIDAVE